jgi:hypothetical protein
MGEELLPQIGLIYKHFKGNLYGVLMYSIDTTQGCTMVIYKCLKTGQVFNRPLSEWFNEIGEGITRFTLHQNGNI